MVVHPASQFADIQELLDVFIAQKATNVSNIYSSDYLKINQINIKFVL